MTPFMQLLLALAIIIGGARLAGLLSARLGQPALLGELLAGLLLGPTLLDIFGWSWFTDAQPQSIVLGLAGLGAVFLTFITGLKINQGALRRPDRAALLAGVLGVVAPLLLGFVAARSFGYTTIESLFIGMLLTASTVGIAAQTLLELGQLRSRVGVALLGATQIGDVLVIVLLSLFIALARGGEGDAIVLAAVRALLFLAGAALLCIWLFPRLLDRAARWPISQPVLTLAIVITLLLAWSAEMVGVVAAITGAFLAGLLFARTRHREEIEGGISQLADSFFVPIFFASIGLATNLLLLDGDLLLFTLAICAVAIVAKLLGGGAGARLAGFSNRESLQVGAAMVARGELSLIVASVGLGGGIIGAELFAAAVLVVLVSLLATPPLLRRVFREPPTIDWRRPPDDHRPPDEGQAAPEEAWRRPKRDTQPLTDHRPEYGRSIEHPDGRPPDEGQAAPKETWRRPKRDTQPLTDHRPEHRRSIEHPDGRPPDDDEASMANPET